MRYEEIFRGNDESITSKHDPSSDLIFPDLDSEFMFPFMEFFSRQNCVSFGLLVSCLSLSQSS